MIHVQFLPAYLNGTVEPMIGLLQDRIARSLLDHDITWGCDAEQADIVWANQHRYDQRTDLPMIVQDVIDWAPINWMARASLSHRHVRRLIKLATFTDPALNNAACFQDTYHGAILHPFLPDTMTTDTPPAPLSPPLTDADFAKIRTGFNWLYQPRLDLLATDDAVPSDDYRDIDVFFAGTTTYARSHVQWHRGQAVKLLRRHTGNCVVSDTRSLTPYEHARMLERTRVAVSPWGFGETCIRDLEALLAGCVLIKPDTSFVTTWPEYHNQPHCFFCRPDLIDLPDVIDRALAEFTSLREAREHFRRQLLQLRRPEVLAERIADLIHEVLAETSG